MTRPLRLQFPGAVYHIYTRGNDRQPTFFDDDDRRMFLRCLSEACEKFEQELASYCLMPNHVHLLLHTPEGGLSRAMHWLFSVYTMRTNRRHGRVGHLFQSRFHSPLVDANDYLVRVSRYIHLNPCKCKRKLCDDPLDYPWSSLRPLLEGRMASRLVLDRFESAQAYRQYVLEGLKIDDDVLAELRNGAFLGGEEFAQEMKSRVAFKPMPGVSRRRELSALPLAALEAALEGRPRSIRMYALWTWGRLTQPEVGARFGISGSAVSRCIRKLEGRLAWDDGLRRELEAVRASVVRNRGLTPDEEDVVGV